MKQYMITDGKGSYIRHDPSGQYVPIRSIKNGTKWNDVKKVNNICKSSLCKSLRGKYYVVSIDTDDDVVVPEEISVRANDCNTQVDIGAAESLVDNSRENPADTGKKIEVMMALVESIIQDQDSIVRNYSTVDKEICDLQHYIELHNLNAYQGYMAYKRLKGMLLRRREAKDQLCIIGNARIMRKAVNGLDKRKYRPRVLNEIFENGLV